MRGVQWRCCVILLLAGIAPVWAESGSLDPVFAKVPFDEWLKGGGQAHFKWRAHANPAQLSMYQRLWTKIEVELDGADLAERRGKGRMLVFSQFTDEAGNRYQDHGVIELGKLEEGIRSQNLLYTQHVFVTPGEYRVAFAIFDAETGEHSVREERLRVGALKSDPLPANAGSEFPPVEFVGASEAPDAWYQPAEKGRLHVTFAPREPVRVEIILNLTPAEDLAGNSVVQDRNLSGLIPMLKILAQAGGPDAPVSVEDLDLSRRRVTFHQDDVRPLDWKAMRQTLEEKGTGAIDLKSLEDRKHNAAFFVQEVARKIGPPPSHPPPVIIVLSSPVSFVSKEDLHPISVDAPPGTRVFYLRYRAPSEKKNPAMMNPYEDGRPIGGFGRRRGPLQAPGNGALQIDQLANTLKPLSPHIFNIDTPEDFRKALAAMLEEVAHL
jgi:hypothetical protein